MPEVASTLDAVLSDPYAILGVARDATPEQVKRAFRRQAKRHHPDLQPSPDAAARMAEINLAYELLSDAGRRGAWDAAHPVAAPQPPGGPAQGDPSPSDAAPAGPAPDATEPDDPPAAAPSLGAALAFVLVFGKFRGRTLGFVAAIEPGYLAWIARTIRDRPELLRHVRVVLAHLERQGWRDTPRPSGHRQPAGAGTREGAGAGARPWAGPEAAGTTRTTGTTRTPWSADESRPARRYADQSFDDQVGRVAVGMMVLGGLAAFVGVPAHTVSGLMGLMLFIGWPVWMVVQHHRHRPEEPRRTASQVWRDTAQEVLIIVVLLAIAWALLPAMIAPEAP